MVGLRPQRSGVRLHRAAGARVHVQRGSMVADPRGNASRELVDGPDLCPLASMTEAVAPRTVRRSGMSVSMEPQIIPVIAPRRRPAQPQLRLTPEGSTLDFDCHPKAVAFKRF